MVYFVADVHLGLPAGDPSEREERFVGFLRSLPPDAEALYLLGDVWDFWYEYRDVVPKTGARAVVELANLAERGVGVYFLRGNHDMWTGDYFGRLGIQILDQPCYREIGGRLFCFAHGDGLGGSRLSYRLLSAVFHSKVARALFSTLHPWIAYRFGTGWSDSNRRKHVPYRFKGADEPLYKFAESALAPDGRRPEFFVFGHFHDSVELRLSDGAQFVVLNDWMKGGCPCAVFDGETLSLSV